MILNFKHFCHVPTLLRLSMYHAGPIIMKNGKGKLPFATYFQTISLYVKMRHYVGTMPKKSIEYSRMYYLYEPFEILAQNRDVHGARDVLRMLAHVNPEVDIQSDVDKLLELLCDDIHVDEAVRCVQKIAELMMSDDDARSNIMFMGLDKFPAPELREAFLNNGAKSLIPEHGVAAMILGALCGDNEQLHRYCEDFVPVGNIDMITNRLIIILMTIIGTRNAAGVEYVLEQFHNHHIKVVATDIDDPYSRYSCLVRNQLDVCDVLHRHGYFDFDGPDDIVLWRSAKTVSAADWLIRHGAPTRHAIEWAVRYNNMPVLDYLVSHAKLPIPRDIFPNVIEWYPELSILNYLIAHGGDVNGVDDDGNSAVYLGGLLVRYLHDVGANIFVKNNKGENTLHNVFLDEIHTRPGFAVECRQDDDDDDDDDDDIAANQVDLDPNVNVNSDQLDGGDDDDEQPQANDGDGDDGGNIPPQDDDIEIEMINDDDDPANSLLRGVDDTELEPAVVLELLDLLVNVFHIDVNDRDHRGTTALMMAMDGHYKPLIPFIDVLIRGGARVNERDDDGHTALYHARRHQESGKLTQLNVIPYLVSLGATE